MIDSAEIEADVSEAQLRNGHAIWLRAAAESIASGGKFDTAYLRRLCDALDSMDDDDDPSGEVTAEGRRLITLPTGHQILLENDGRLSLQGEYPPEERRAVAAYLVDHPIVTEEVSHEPLKAEDYIPGDHAASAGDQLVEMLQEGRRRPNRPVVVAQAPTELTVDGLPVPDASLSLEQVRDRLMTVQQGAAKWSGETAGGLAVPE